VRLFQFLALLIRLAAFVTASMAVEASSMHGFLDWVHYYKTDGAVIETTWNGYDTPSNKVASTAIQTGGTTFVTASMAS
jgi:hypothetical protein